MAKLVSAWRQNQAKSRRSVAKAGNSEVMVAIARKNSVNGAEYRKGKEMFIDFNLTIKNELDVMII